MSIDVQDAIVVRKIKDAWYLRRIVLSEELDGASSFQPALYFSSREEALSKAYALDRQAPTTHGVLELNETPRLYEAPALSKVA